MLTVALVIVFTKAMFTSYKEEQVMTSDGNIYLLQYGSYINREVMNENIKKLNDYIIYEHDNKYYVHLGAFTRLNTALKMQKIFEKENIYTYIKNDYLGNSDVINDINKLDDRLYEEENINRIKEINKEILNLLKNSVS